MAYKFVNIEHLTVFLSSLQDLFASKHEIIKEALPVEIAINLDDGLAEEVIAKKLELTKSDF